MLRMSFSASDAAQDLISVSPARTAETTPSDDTDTTPCDFQSFGNPVMSLGEC
jgi:hypothetical protein